MNDFSPTIYKWYSNNKRDLPWRTTNDPYKIWLSEIILQQTRVKQGIDYYTRFTESFPTVKQLALAEEDLILKYWQGLGYYSRARNLHSAAKEIVNNFNGQFPNSYSQILKLKGIGPYTAAAIASIAFNLPFATVDGNVYRVLSRYFGIHSPIDSTKGKKEFDELAKELLNKNAPGLHNQALMEFGALQCVPKSPNCEECPLFDLCIAARNKTVGQLPVKAKKTKQSKRYFYYYLIEEGNKIFIEKRTGNDIWKNLYQIPLFESQKKLSNTELLKTPVPFIKENNYSIVSVSEQKKHILSHQIITARLVRIEILGNVDICKPLFSINKKDISKFAVPRLTELFFEDYNLIDKNNTQTTAR